MSRRKKPAYLSPIVEEIQKLEFKEDDNAFTGKDARRLDSLRTKRRQEQRDALPKLTCCDAGRNSCSLMYSIDIYDSKASNKITEGRWRLSEYESLTRDVRRNDPEWHKIQPPQPKFCPFCAAVIPKMRLMKEPPKDIAVVTDGGYYCDTCQERLSSCMCLPPEAAFEPIPG